MTRPRCILPEKTYLITRRCSERRFFLRPDAEVTRIFKYVLAIAAERHKIELHAFVAMSNHYHLVLTDRYGQLPDFEQYLNSLLARSINCFRGRWESFWDPDSYSGVELVESEDVLERIVYTVMNPVAASLVTRARRWEGATSIGMVFDEGQSIERPRGFFGKRMPKQGVLKIVPPPRSDEIAPDVLQRMINERVRKAEESRDRTNKVLGMEGVLAQHWNSSPDTFEPRRELNPRVAARRRSARIEALQRSKDWLTRYYVALARFRAGERDVEFPRGTYWMCVKLRCRSAAA